MGRNGGFTGQVVFSGATAAVPEPATWAMMMLGLGAVGFAPRRSRTPARLAGERRLSIA